MQTLGHINLAGIADSVSLSSETCSLPTSLIAPEGIYRQMTISEYSRLNRMPINQVTDIFVARMHFSRPMAF